jgi:protein SCO1
MGGRGRQRRRRQPGAKSLGPVASALVGVVLVGAVLGACSAPPDPPPANLGSIEHRVVPASLRSMSLTDQHGHQVDLDTWRDRTVVLVPFMSLCGDVCPMDTGNMVQAQHVLDRAGEAGKVELVEVSVDPGRDSPARLAAYAHLTGASFEMVTEAPSTLAAFERYFGWYAQRVPEDNPPDVDWWTGKPLTYDIDHSDGFDVIGSSGALTFSTGAAPDFHGRLDPTIRKFLSDEGRSYLAHPPKPGWTTAQLLGTIAWATGHPLPQ